MSYSVIYKRFQVILDDSKLRDILRESPYMNMDISSENQKCKVCIEKILVHFRENVFSVSVKRKEIKDQLK
jgi:hypothetical protein